MKFIVFLAPVNFDCIFARISTIAVKMCEQNLFLRERLAEKIIYLRELVNLTIDVHHGDGKQVGYPLAGW